jgi:hypothetical protein
MLFLVCGILEMAAAMTSCGGGTIGPPPPRQLVSVAVQPSSTTATQGVTVQFSATGTFNQAPLTQTNLPVQWTSSDTNIATIDPSIGNATCVSVGGPVTINASAQGKGEMLDLGTLPEGGFESLANASSWEFEPRRRPLIPSIPLEQGKNHGSGNAGRIQRISYLDQ